MIDELNEKYKGTTTFAVNKFTDLTREEFEKRYTGIKKSDRVGKYLETTPEVSDH